LLTVPWEPASDSKNAARCEEDLLLAATRFFVVEGCAPEEAPGYSGSAFARVESSGRLWLLRRWPAGFDAARLRFVHRVLIESRAAGFEGVPRLARTDEGQAIVEIAGHLYDAHELLPGRPFPRGNLVAGRCQMRLFASHPDVWWRWPRPLRGFTEVPRTFDPKGL
jgi:hypothetical protein